MFYLSFSNRPKILSFLILTLLDTFYFICVPTLQIADLVFRTLSSPSPRFTNSILLLYFSRRVTVDFYFMSSRILFFYNNFLSSASTSPTFLRASSLQFMPTTLFPNILYRLQQLLVLCFQLAVAFLECFNFSCSFLFGFAQYLIGFNQLVNFGHFRLNYL